MRCGFRHEKKLRASLGIGRIAGIDEAGRGALAGPVVAAAAILPERFRHRKLNDSKQLCARAARRNLRIPDESFGDRLGRRDRRFDRDRPDQYPARFAPGDAHRGRWPDDFAGARPDRRAAGLSVSAPANRDHRWRLPELEHRGGERDREGDARHVDAGILRALSAVLFQPAQGLRNRAAPPETP